MESEGGSHDDKEEGGSMLRDIQPIMYLVAQPQDETTQSDLPKLDLGTSECLSSDEVLQQCGTNTVILNHGCSMSEEPPSVTPQPMEMVPNHSAVDQIQGDEPRTTSQLNLSEAPLTTVEAPVLSSILGQPTLAQQGTIAAIDDSVLQLTTGSTAGQTTYLHMLCKEDNLNSGAELHQCKWMECSDKFPHLEALVNHVNDKHVKVEHEVEYRCHWQGCPRRGKGFNARYKMLIHVRTHTNEKPHRCGICEKSFSRLENLKIHMRSHTGEKPYVCPFEGCHKAYSNSSDRFKHVRTHQMDKPYCCKTPGCNKRYTDPSSLRKHIKTYGHFGRGDLSEVSSMQETTVTQSNPVTVSANKTSTPIPVANTVFSLLPNGITNHSLPTQVISIQGNMLHISTLASNPLLSSAIMPSSSVNTQTISTQTDTANSDARSPETPTKDLSGESGILEDSEKVQDTPLDLSTSPLSTHNQEDGAADVVNANYCIQTVGNTWELWELKR